MKANLLVWLTLASSSFAIAQTSTTFKEQFKLIKAPNAIASVGVDLFGDKVNLYSGSVEFVQNDVSLPGNSRLPVSIGRRLAVGQFAFDDRAFGKWSLEIPHLHGVFARSSSSALPGWVGDDGSNLRCSKFGAPAEAVGLQGSSKWHPREFWRGNYLYVPGAGDQQMLRRAPDYTRTPSPVRLDGVDVKAFSIVTGSHWAIGCLPSLKNYPTLGEGFLVISPEGTKYKFDWLVTYKASTLTKSWVGPSPNMASEADNSDVDATPDSIELDEDDLSDVVTSPTLPRTEVWILPTKIVDRFGNTVTYTYDPENPANLTKIEANDGRTIKLTYVLNAAGKPTNLVRTVDDGTRKWTYNYEARGSGRILSSVVLPDGSAWDLAQADQLLADPQYGSEPSYCTERLAPNYVQLQATLVHPSGAAGTFVLEPVEHGRSRVQRVCVDKGIRTPNFYYTNSLTSKTISGPGLDAMTWSYNWEPANGSFSTCTTCIGYEVMTVTAPEGDVTRHVFGNQYFIDEGKLLLTDIGWKGNTALRSTRISYRPPDADNPYPEQVGYVDELLGSSSSDVRLMPEESRIITQQGVEFSWVVEAFDDLARPLQVRKSTQSNMSRTEITTYFDNDARWVLGQIAEVKSGDKSMTKTTYDSTTLLPQTKSSFGNLQHSMAYWPDGTIATLKEGRKTTKFSSYVRGTPQTVQYMSASGTTIYATERSKINNLGNPDSTTDTEGHITSYRYDAMGRLSTITYPTTSPAWSETTISFTRSTSSKYDLPAGHWIYQIKTGNGYIANYYDALWRPVISEQWDSTNSAETSRITKRRFDSNGSTTYESYPKRTFEEIGDGTHYEFDALGRPLVIGKNSELGMLHSKFNYLSGFVTEQVDNRSSPTHFSYLTFDQPAQDMITNIAAPHEVKTVIKRDNFGKPLAITRSGGGKSATRTYIYDTNERLCKTIEPETGGTIQAYDTYNAIAWKAAGQSKDEACATSALKGTKTSFEYDHMNRLITTTFEDNSPKISRTYTRDGLLATVSSDGSMWSNLYNNRRMLRLETLSYGGYTYNILRGYDTNGNLKTMTYPVDHLAVDYAPNALGEPTKAGTFATKVTYHPNGAIKSFTYGNGIEHTLTQNTRGLPKRSTDAGVLSDEYEYDENANVTKITDYQADLMTRAMKYDDLDRLRSVIAPKLWETASYDYDSLDNLTGTTITGGATKRTSTHIYDPVNNLLKSISSNVASYSQGFAHDARGNITRRGAQEFTFDLANRMIEAKNRGTYKYDGFGRRFSIVGTDGVNRVNVYSQDEKLMYAGIAARAGIKYIFLKNHLVAEAGSGYTQYVHTDGLGSPVATTEKSKRVISRTYYEPYGAKAGGDIPVIGFTGHVNAADIGLVYMQQRYYDPIAGRFLSIDPMTVNTNKGENFNRFVYGANNPYKYVDPDGRDIKIVGTEDYRKTVLADLATTREKPHGAALVSAAEKTPQTITIRDSPTGLNFTASPKTSNKVPANSTVFYNPSSTQGGTDENGSTERPAFIGLVHEIRHALAAAEGKQVFDKGDRKSGTTPPSEEEAMKTENAVRKEHDLPQRPHYY